MDDSAIKAFLSFAFLGWASENIKNWRYKDFLSCNPIYKYYFSKDICFVPFPFAYGLGGLVIWYLWKKYPNMSLLAKAIIFAILFNAIELAGGYIAEKVICKEINTCTDGNRMWNYTNSHNIGGHIDIEHTFYWVVAGMIGYLIWPLIERQSWKTLGIIAVLLWIAISVWKYPKAIFNTPVDKINVSN